jgi:hypothetical protein
VTEKAASDPVFILTSLGELLQRVPGKSKPLEQPLEFIRSGFALGGPRLTSRHLASSTVCSRFTHQIETAQSFAKHGVTDIAASMPDDGACPFICGIRLQWQFKDEACGVLTRHSQETTRRFACLQGACGKSHRACRAFRRFSLPAVVTGLTVPMVGLTVAAYVYGAVVIRTALASTIAVTLSSD